MIFTRLLALMCATCGVSVLLVQVYFYLFNERSGESYILDIYNVYVRPHERPRWPSAVATIQEATGDEDFESKLAAAGEKLVVIEFVSVNSNACRLMAPYLDETALEFPNIEIIIVDVDVCPNTSAKYLGEETSAYPIFAFMRSGKEKSEYRYGGIVFTRLLQSVVEQVLREPID